MNTQVPQVLYIISSLNIVTIFKLSYQPLSLILVFRGRYVIANDKAGQKAMSGVVLRFGIHMNHPEDILKPRLQGHLQRSTYYIWS